MTQVVAAAVLASVLTAAAMTAGAGAQVQDATEAVFEVASVRPNKSGDGRVMVGVQPGGRFTATNVPLRLLLRQAFDVQDFQIVGGPDWLGSDRFDVVAKTPEGQFSFEQIRPMIKALLVERFQLAAHNETREMPVYALAKSRDDGKLGPKLTPAATDCTAAARGRRGGGPPPGAPQPGQRLECGLMVGLGRLNGGGMGMGELARSLSPMVGRIVLDRTGLTGAYDFELTYTPEGLGGAPPPLLNGAPPPPIDPNAPTLFTALREQLGLELDSQRGQVEVVVIDRVERPTVD